MNRDAQQQPLPQRPAAPLEILIEEHRVILRALAALEQQVDAFQSGGVFQRTWFAQMVTFLQAFADRRHHGKEEALLFAVMAENLGYSRRTGPIMVLSGEHEMARTLLQDIGAAAGETETDPAAARQLIITAREYIRLLRSHIEREDDKVFPLVEDLLCPEERARLADAFTSFEVKAEQAEHRTAALRLFGRLTRGDATGRTGPAVR
jgi:hemerythrin-like domain-containing protein